MVLKIQNIEIFTRVIIEHEDIVILTGYSDQKVWAMCRKMRVKYNKPKPQCLTFEDFMDFTGISEKVIKDYLTFRGRL